MIMMMTVGTYLLDAINTNGTDWALATWDEIIIIENFICSIKKLTHS
jgi:uncharacterized membrane protein YhhN